MYAATSPSDLALDNSAQTPADKTTGMVGHANMSFAVASGQTRLKDLYQTSPMRVLCPGKAPGDEL